MTTGEVQWLSSHLGHNVSTHMNNYRLHAPAIEITKVGKLLMAIDEEGAAFAGRRRNALLDDCGADTSRKRARRGVYCCLCFAGSAVTILLMTYNVRVVVSSLGYSSSSLGCCLGLGGKVV